MEAMAIHVAAERGFGRGADMYERGRPEYPAAAIRWLSRRLGLGPGVCVVDLAAGTGKLTRPLAASGARVIAVEPVAAMRAAIGPGLEAVDGRAEAIPLSDGTVDAVTVGQAFHWFDHDAALPEIHRVLRADGWLALVWNAHRMEDPIHTAIERLVKPFFAGVPRHRTASWRLALERTDLFAGSGSRRFAHRQRLDADGLADRVGSISVIAALPEAEREPVLARVRALAADGPVTLRYRCEIELLQRCGR
jgi:SAM-dependent methyltransferase